MREFFKYVFATVVGFVLSIVIIGVLCFVIVVAAVSSMSSEKSVAVSSNSVLYLDLNQPITERTPKNTFGNLPIIGNGGKEGIGLNDLLKSISRAKNDDNIKCIYINVTSPNTGLATMREVRNALIDFKKSHKQIIAYSEVYTQGAYYLASAADKVYLNPQGSLEFKGFKSELTFFKGTLEKAGVEMQVIRVGNYKSAVEPYILDKMSDYNRTQVTAYVNGLYNTFLTDIAQSRNVQKDSLYAIADDYKIQKAQDAVDFKLVDGLMYKDQILDELRKLSGRSKKETIRSVTINDYATSNSDKETGEDKVAIIYASGEISGGEGNDNQIGSERISRAIRKARLDDDIKAIVLRVNSPGGDALASDVIWREVVLAKKEKPVIASFGDVAASGGYYIACAADSIFVQPNSITGSIGIFGLIPNFQNLLTNKLGVTFDGVKTGKYADIMSTNRPMTAGEKFIIQGELNRFYDGFITRVADGRKKTKTYIDSVGGGHVWVGTDAVQIGLADRVGSFNDAIKSAAKKAKLKNYKVVEYPEVVDPIKSLLTDGTDKVKTYYAKQELGDNYLLYQQIKKVMGSSGMQARMPFEAVIK
ncbi:signal peptide peptidase SppA [Pedobacter changchengzhani]|uniref:Signal peptide peptidase SppA n=1 Tax=Pedobacter changchengzhani TaxID=2529274 RepID=A0A4R5MMU2_9SPHI|nr:signal peptide peptidase SppA [Pedobacter changchengzhani]TDG37008.1 signal peptide peptidase SppA [Pedobacter changchengzhani]